MVRPVVKKDKKLPGETLMCSANNAFAADVYQAQLPVVASKNLIFSPFSLHSVLSMASQGARGQTRTEMLRGLRFKEGQNNKGVENAYQSVISAFQEKKSANGKKKTGGDEKSPITLLTANRVYSRTGFTLNRTFVKSLEQNFMSDFQQLDLSTPVKRESAADAINDWVATKTENKITEIIGPDSLNHSTGLVLVNCIYFKGKWASKFNAKATSVRAFHLTPSKDVKVPFMTKTLRFPYGELPELDAEVLQIPYKGYRLAMWIILPKTVNGLAKIQKSIELLRQNGKDCVKSAISKWARKPFRYTVELAMPKFKCETTMGNLTEILKKNMGMKTMFSATADFGGIPDEPNDNPLNISRVIQKAFICVDEEGTEAAAVTVTDVRRRMKPGKQPVFKLVQFIVDRPFYFEIVDHKNDNLVLFSGHVNDPSKK